MIGEFKLKIAEAVTLVIKAAAFSASLGFLTLGFVFLGIFALVREFSELCWVQGSFLRGSRSRDTTGGRGEGPASSSCA